MFLCIIIPVYNTQLYISECLDSLEKQDISKDDYEIICIDDGSTDDSLSIIRKFAEKYPNIVVIHQENAGASVARNRGMDTAKGDYYWFVDSDDFVRENVLSELREMCITTECDCLSFRLYYFQDSEREEIKEKINFGEIYSNSQLRAQPTMLISRRAIGTLRWHEGIEVGEDSLFLRELQMQGLETTKIDDTVYFYRQHGNSAIHHSPNAGRRMISHVKGAILAKELYEKPNGQCEANANLLRMFMIYAMVAICQSRGAQGKEVLAIMKKEGLFPSKFPKEATSKNSFHTTRTDFVGKVYSYLCCHSCSRFGYSLLKIYYRLFDYIKG